MPCSRQLPRYFEGPLILKLSLYQSREWPDDQVLFLLIQTRERPEAALARLFRFEEEWLSHQKMSEDGMLVVDVDYV